MVFKHTHLKKAWILNQINQEDGFFTYPSPFPPPPPSPPPPLTGTFHKDSTPSTGTKISPAVLFIIVILAVLFFISGLLHLLVRFLIKHPSSPSSQSNGYPEISTSDALQRQLQQLFHLHDSGLDQAFIDALPIFIYKEIVGLKEPFDCAVCLCEFNEKDKLRLLPTCSHAFHINCIDTWLLSNSSCPLCRGTLCSPGFSIENPVFDFDDPTEEDGCSVNGRNGLSSGQKSIEIEEVRAEKGVFPVRLGKFRRLNQEKGEDVGETSSSNLDARRCFSMGSYQYLLGDTNLRVALNNRRDDRDARGSSGGDLGDDNDLEGKKIGIGTKTDSYSVSKIWLWSKKGKFASSSSNPSLDSELPWMGRIQDIE